MGTPVGVDGQVADDDGGFAVDDRELITATDRDHRFGGVLAADVGDAVPGDGDQSGLGDAMVPHESLVRGGDLGGMTFGERLPNGGGSLPVE